MNRKRCPIRWNVRGESELVLFGIRLQAEHAMQYRADHHSCGPYLMRRAGGKGLVVVSRENFRKVTERTVGAEQRIGAKVGVRRERAMVAVFGHRGPSRK